MVMESALSYSILAETGKQVTKGEGKGKLEEDGLVISPKFGETLSFSFREIIGIESKNYKLHLTLGTGEKLVLSDLGYDYEDFLRVLNYLRNEVLLKDMLMHETLKKSDVEAEFVHTDESGKVQKGEGKIRLYETGLVFIPENGEMFRIPYSDLAEISEKGLGLAVTTEYGEKLSLSKMGRELDPFKKTFSDINNELQLKVISYLKELVSGIDSASLRAAARLMKEGKAAKRKDIEAINPKLWAGLENKLSSSGAKEAYDFLRGLSHEERICIGLKRGLMGDLTGEYIWFLIPIYAVDPKKPGNAVVMEAIEVSGAATEAKEAPKGTEPAVMGTQEVLKEVEKAEAAPEGGGKATYFFRIVSRKDYPKFKKLDDLNKEVDKFITTINRCMLAINFRREPIFLPDEKLEDSRYQRYKFAVQKIPSLQTLRGLFIGRVIHASPEQWKEDVMDLLKFNVGIRDDNAKWQKGGSPDAA